MDAASRRGERLMRRSPMGRDGSPLEIDEHQVLARHQGVPQVHLAVNADAHARECAFLEGGEELAQVGLVVQGPSRPTGGPRGAGPWPGAAWPPRRASRPRSIWERMVWYRARW